MSTELQPQNTEPSADALATIPKGPLAFMTSPAALGHLWRIATGYSRSQLVPDAFKRKPDDCFIACQLALRLNVDPFMLMQNMYVVCGRPGFEAKLAVALLNASGKIKGTLKTTFVGKKGTDDYGCFAWAIDADTGEKVTGPTVDWKTVTEEGWNKDKPLRDGKGVQKSKWNTMPDLMFVYRAASFFIKANYPEVLMGMQTREELEDSQPVRVEPQFVQGQTVQGLLGGQDADVNQTDPRDETPETPVASTLRPETFDPNDPRTAMADLPPDHGREPVVSQTATEADDGSPVAGYLSLVRKAKTIGEVKAADATARKDESLMDLERSQINAAIDARIADLRAARGERTNG
jgi:hypothetical protein